MRDNHSDKYLTYAGLVYRKAIVYSTTVTLRVRVCLSVFAVLNAVCVSLKDHKRKILFISSFIKINVT